MSVATHPLGFATAELALEALRGQPNALAKHYARFAVEERILLTGHSHQAWPDVAWQGVQKALEDASRYVDEKWEAAFAQAERVRAFYARLLGGGATAAELALGANTHELVARFLSALDLRARPRLVTTDGEYHSVRRQLARLAEEGIEVVVVAADEPADLAARLAAALDDRTAAVLVSTVLFRSGRIVPGLAEVAAAARKVGAELLLDAYHQLNVVPCDLGEAQLAAAFVVGGGYKYCQMGEGCAFLRVPPGRNLRPVLTGWFAEFSALSQRSAGIAYGPSGAAFAGATYDPISHYRAAAVAVFFETMGLDVGFLRRVSQHQVGRLARRFDELDLDPAQIRRPALPLEQLGGFLALETPHAARLSRALAERQVSTDFRDRSLRFGPAPYLNDSQLDDAMVALGEAARSCLN